MKMNFEYFQIQKWILKTGRLEKVGQENGVICLVSMLLSWVIFFKLSKKVHFLQFCADLSKKSTSIKVIYIYASERSRYTLSENGIVCCAMTYYFWDISVWSRRILLNFCWVNNFFNVSIVNNSWTVAQTPINHSFFWTSVMRNLRYIYVNCFNSLRFLAEVSTNFKKFSFLDNLKTLTQEGNLEARQMTLFFPSTLYALNFCNIHFYICK